MASPVLRVVMVNLEKRGSYVLLCVFGELLDRMNNSAAYRMFFS